LQLDNYQLRHEFRMLPYNTLIQLFFALIIFDIISAYAKSLKTNDKLQPYALITHLLIIILVVGSYPFLSLIGYLKDVLVTFYALHYAINAIQNLGELGAPIPEALLETLTTLKTKKSAPKNCPYGARSAPLLRAHKDCHYQNCPHKRKKSGNPNQSRPPN